MACLLLFCVVFFFPFSLLKTAVYGATIFSFISSSLKSLVHMPRDTRKAIFQTDKKTFFFFLALSFMKFPQRSFAFKIPKNFLQKADIVNPIININSKLEAVCVRCSTLMHGRYLLLRHMAFSLINAI